jgi:hypothetical protein
MRATLYVNDCLFFFCYRRFDNLFLIIFQSHAALTALLIRVRASLLALPVSLDSLVPTATTLVLPVHMAQAVSSAVRFALIESSSLIFFSYVQLQLPS